jgi:hypothetical protein
MVQKLTIINLKITSREKLKNQYMLLTWKPINVLSYPVSYLHDQAIFCPAFCGKDDERHMHKLKIA